MNIQDITDQLRDEIEDDHQSLISVSGDDLVYLYANAHDGDLFCITLLFKEGLNQSYFWQTLEQVTKENEEEDLTMTCLVPKAMLACGGRLVGKTPFLLSV